MRAALLSIELLCEFFIKSKSSYPLFVAPLSYLGSSEANDGFVGGLLYLFLSSSGVAVVVKSERFIAQRSGASGGIQEVR